MQLHRWLAGPGLALLLVITAGCQPPGDDAGSAATAGSDEEEESAPVPVEVLAFAVPVVMKGLLTLGGTPVIREGVKKDGPVITDNGNWIVDCTFPHIENPEELECAINSMPGVLSCGIFTEFTGKTKGACFP